MNAISALLSFAFVLALSDAALIPSFPHRFRSSSPQLHNPSASQILNPENLQSCSSVLKQTGEAASLGVKGLKGLRGGGAEEPGPEVLVVGSINADIIIPVSRLPKQGECLTAMDTPEAGKVFTGGKGANQAVALSRLGANARFVGKIGSDAHGPQLLRSLEDNGVDVLACQASSRPSGQGLVFLQEGGGVSSIVVHGSNADWDQDTDFLTLMSEVKAVLLQREVPEHVNLGVAKAAREAKVPVFLDIGGQDRDISDEMLELVDFVCPNETELQRLTAMPTGSGAEVLAAAKSLKSRGAKNVLVTLGAEGSLLLDKDGGEFRQGCCPLPKPDGKVVDETGAGDSFRAAFALAMLQGLPTQRCLEYAAAAGAITVSRMGAVPSLPTKAEVDALCMESFGGGKAEHLRGGGEEEEFPLKFGSRLNSMKDRQDLWEGENSVLGWIARQGKVKGLDLVDFNYPQHFEKCSKEEIKQALQEANLRTGAICLRFPKEMQAGAYTSPDPALRKRAISLTIEAAALAKELGAGEVVIWSAYCGYDYHFQTNYDQQWEKVKTAFQEVCDAHPDVKVSLEYKPTDENTRFFAVPTTGAAMLLVTEINRQNMGLTLDFGHMLVAGENPAQSVAMAGRAGKLYGVQLNDGYGRGEDGLMFGSVHSNMALEMVWWLQKSNFPGHIYFDTFPRNEDPVREAEYNIRKFKTLWNRAKRLSEEGVEEFMEKQDALGAIELLDRV